METFLERSCPVLVLSASFPASVTAPCLLEEPGFFPCPAQSGSGETALILSPAWPWVPFEV